MSSPNTTPDYKTLYQELQAQHQFTLSQISHEIRNPVALIHSFLQLLESHHPEISQDYCWNKIMENMDFLKTLLDEFSSFNNSGKLRMQKLELTSLFREIVTSVTPACQKQDICISLEIVSPIPLVYADKTKIQQLILNLLRNSMEAMSTKGSIICTLQSDEKNVHISVKDTGEGIPDDYRNTLFEPFITHKQEGTGLGLAICKRIVLAHNGTISYTSMPHKGTEFEILLPVA